MHRDITLRPWQLECSDKCIRWYQMHGQRLFLVKAALGTGKTVLGSAIADVLFELNGIDRVIVIAPRKEVVRQWSQEFKYVTGRAMTKVTGADPEIGGDGLDICATWSAIEGLLDAFASICDSERVMVICDEHHHAAIEAAWGRGADGAFANAQYALILTGTPIRSDDLTPVWFAYDSEGRIDHPEDGSYTLSYGEAVGLGYCRPITFHRHEGHFSVTLDDGDSIEISGSDDLELSEELRRLPGLQASLDFYKLACTPKYLGDGKSPDLESYQATMLEYGISKLESLRNSVPNAGGLVIAPSIEVAEHMARMLECLEGEKPIIVHSKVPNAENKISSFRESRKKWLVSVNMVSEGVDIKRLRVIVFLPYALTELFFRQAMGRAVRSLGPDDFSRAYVIMPAYKIFEEFARRVEAEMPAKYLSEGNDRPRTRKCPTCDHDNALSATTCSFCDSELSSTSRTSRLKTCPECENTSLFTASECNFCGHSFMHNYEVRLNDALRDGAIVRGIDLNEREVVLGEENHEAIKSKVFSSGDAVLVDLIKSKRQINPRSTQLNPDKES